MNNTKVQFKWQHIVKGMQEGDNEAFEAFYKLTYSKLKKRMLVKTGFNEQDTEDLLQEVYIRVFSKIGDLKDTEAVIGWANSICDSIFLDHVKKETRRAGIANVINESAMQNPDDDIDDFSLDMIADPDSDIEALIEHQEVQSILKEIISALPDSYRNCIELQLSDKSVREIADELQLNENTVKTLIRRAKLQIKDKVLDLEKKGTKLYGIAPLVFFVYIYRIWIRRSEYIPTGSAKAIAEIASVQPGSVPGQEISAKYSADASGITEELKGQSWQNGITAELKNGGNATGHLNSTGIANGISASGPAVSAGTASAAGAAGLGIGKTIAIVAAGVITTAAVAIGSIVAVNNLIPPVDNLFPTDGIVNQTADAAVIEEIDEQPITTEKEIITSETEAVIYDVSEDFLGKWGSYDKLGINPQPDIVSITDISDGKIFFNSIINGSAMHIKETAVMQEDGRAYFTCDNEKQGYLTLNNSGQLILYIDGDDIGEIVFALRDKFNHTPFIYKASALDVLKSLYSTLYHQKNQGALPNIEYDYSIDENGYVMKDQYYSYSYDEDGRIIDNYVNETYESEFKYEYNGQGNLLAEYLMADSGKSIGIKLIDGSYIYDLSGYDPATLGAGLAFYGLYYYEYDDEGKLLSRIHQGESDSIYSMTYTLFEYDDKGRVIHMTQYPIHYIDRSLGEPLVIRNYTWNEDNSCLITEDRTIEGGPGSTMHYELSTQHSEVQLSSNEYIMEFGVPVSPLTSIDNSLY